MEEQKDMELRLWDFIDGRSTEEEQNEISQLLIHNRYWQSKYNELMIFHRLLEQDKPDMPSMRFTKNVLEEINQYHVSPATNTYINKRVIRGITTFFLTMLGGLLIYLFGQIHWVSNDGDTYHSGHKFELNQIDWSKILNGSSLNIFIGINIILGLILIDRYFEGRKKSSQEG
jgi:hypothetical protein